MSSPYRGLPPEAFWRTGVASTTPETIQGLYKKKFEIGRSDQIATAGSCFAQHIARRMRAVGYSVIDMEPPPPGLKTELAQQYGYELYSARYGNIYTARQLYQLIRESINRWNPADAIWSKGDRWVDALRPNVEPRGLASMDEVRAHREIHLGQIRTMLKRADVFVFTLGLTEAWIHTESGTVYPTAPGTIAGTFDPAIHSFHNFRFEEVLSDLMAIRRLLLYYNANSRMLLTVSPVPLAATASHQHVLPATIMSKSILRAAAGEMESHFSNVDYFPSYEVISSPFSQGRFYEDDARNVREEGVSVVMEKFFSEHPPFSVEKKRSAAAVVCEEALLEAFA